MRSGQGVLHGRRMLLVKGKFQEESRPRTGAVLSGGSRGAETLDVGRHPDVDPNEGCFELDVSDLEVGLGTLAGGDKSREGVTSWLLEACGGEATESKKPVFWQGAERSLPITLILILFVKWETSHYFKGWRTMCFAVHAGILLERRDW